MKLLMSGKPRPLTAVRAGVQRLAELRFDRSHGRRHKNDETSTHELRTAKYVMVVVVSTSLAQLNANTSSALREGPGEDGKKIGISEDEADPHVEVWYRLCVPHWRPLRMNGSR